MADRFDIVDCHMRKFGDRIEGNGEFSRFGLSSMDVPSDILDCGSERAAARYILDNLWLEMFDGLGEHTATLLLQLWISSGNSMFDIVTLLFLSENASEENSWLLNNPSYDNLKFEINSWLRSSNDMELARRISYAALNFYMNYDAGHSNDIEQLKLNIKVGYDHEPIAMFMDDDQIGMYNAIISEDSVYHLRENAQEDPLDVPEDEPVAEDEIPDEKKRNGPLWLAIAFMAAVLVLTSDKKPIKKEAENASQDDARLE